jgi:PiT family inorganic phosphate transporter
MGVGAAKKFSAIKWGVVERIVWAWIFTLPVSGGIAYTLVALLKTLGWYNSKL